MAQVSLTDTGYANARVRGMRSRLLDRQFLEKMLSTNGLMPLLHELERTDYKREIEEVVAAAGEEELTSADMDMALDRNLARTFSKILNFIDGEPRRLLTIILGRWDLQNIKTVLRGKHMHFTHEKVEKCLLPVAQLDAVALKELVRAEGVKGVIDALATLGIPYAKPLNDALGEYYDTGDLAHLELSLDKYFYAYGLSVTRSGSVNAELTRQVLKAEIDMLNVMTLFRIQERGLTPDYVEELYIPGGAEVDHEQFTKLSLAGDVEGVIEMMRNTSYYPALQKHVEDYMERGLLSPLQRSLEEGLVDMAAVDIFKGGQLTIGVVIGYIFAKHNEVVNLRIILRGKTMGMPMDTIKEALILI